jgi:hypothetical protein
MLSRLSQIGACGSVWQLDKHHLPVESASPLLGACHSNTKLPGADEFKALLLVRSAKQRSPDEMSRFASPEQTRIGVPLVARTHSTAVSHVGSLDTDPGRGRLALLGVVVVGAANGFPVAKSNIQTSQPRCNETHSNFEPHQNEMNTEGSSVHGSGPIRAQSWRKPTSPSGVSDTTDIRCCSGLDAPSASREQLAFGWVHGRFCRDPCVNLLLPPGAIAPLTFVSVH